VVAIAVDVAHPSTRRRSAPPALQCSAGHSVGARSASGVAVSRIPEGAWLLAATLIVDLRARSRARRADIAACEATYRAGLDVQPRSRATSLCDVDRVQS